MKHSNRGDCMCDACIAAREGIGTRLQIPTSLLDADGAQPTTLELFEKAVKRQQAGLDPSVVALPESHPLVARIEALEKKIVEERHLRVRVEGQLARMQVESRAAIDLEAARHEVKYLRELSYEQLVAALSKGTRDLPALVGTVREALDEELGKHAEPWEDLTDRERRHIAANIVQAIAVDLAERDAEPD